MKLFCKGAIFGMVTGAVLGMVVIAKNKNLINFIKEKVDIAENKVSKMTDKIKKSLEEKNNKEKNTCEQTQNCNNSAVETNSNQHYYNHNTCC